MARRYFTLTQANDLVPRVAAHMRTIIQVHVHLRRITRQLSATGVPLSAELLAGDEPVSVAVSDSGIHLIAHAQALYDTIRSTVEAIENLGAQVKDVESGLVDFYSLRDGTKEVLLCWRMGEPEITHYHEPHSGFSGRQPVAGHDFYAQPR